MGLQSLVFKGDFVTKPNRGRRPERPLGESGMSPAKSEALKVKNDLHRAIMDIVRDRGYTRRDLERILEQPQPRISELVNGHITGVSIEKLLHYLTRLGATPSIEIRLDDLAG